MALAKHAACPRASNATPLWQRILAVGMLVSLGVTGLAFGLNASPSVSDVTTVKPSASVSVVSRNGVRTGFTTRNMGSWSLGGDPDTLSVSMIPAANPMIRMLVNTRDLHAVPDGFDPDHLTGDTGNAYPYGQCTWWAYQRRSELGLPTGSLFGNATDWADSARRLGYWVSSTPLAGDAVVFHAGQYDADPVYGHVGVVERVDADGSVRISEANVGGRVGPFTRIIPADRARELEYIHY